MEFCIYFWSSFIRCISERRTHSAATHLVHHGSSSARVMFSSWIRMTGQIYSSGFLANGPLWYWREKCLYIHNCLNIPSALPNFKVLSANHGFVNCIFLWTSQDIKWIFWSAFWSKFQTRYLINKCLTSNKFLPFSNLQMVDNWRCFLRFCKRKQP